MISDRSKISKKCPSRAVGLEQAPVKVNPPQAGHTSLGDGDSRGVIINNSLTLPESLEPEEIPTNFPDPLMEVEEENPLSQSSQRSQGEDRFYEIECFIDYTIPVFNNKGEKNLIN